MIINNLKVLGVQMISMFLLDILGRLFYPNNDQPELYFIVGFLVYLLLFVAAGYYLIDHQGTSLKNLLSFSIMSLFPFLFALFKISVPDDSSFFLLFDLTRPPITLSSLFLPVNVTIDVTARYWLDLISMPLPVLYMWFGLRMSTLRKRV